MPEQTTKKAQIISAALALFRQKGIKATTTKDIAKKACVSEGTIYRHFKNKAALAETIFEHNVNFFWEFLREYLKKAHSVDTMLLAFVEGVFSFSRKYQQQFSFVLTAHQTELQKLSRNKMKPLRILKRLIRLGQSQKIFRTIDIDLAAAMIMGLVAQTIFYQKSGQIAVDHKTVVHETAQACLQILKLEQ